MLAIEFNQYGGPSVLEQKELEIPPPGPNQVLIRVRAVGVNYADTARRENKYVVPTPLPFIPGYEVAGTVEAAGEQAEGYEPGTRVVALIDAGGYAEFAVADYRSLIRIPDGVDFARAVALPLQGLTAYHCLLTMGRMEPGETVLVHAAAGGVGTLAVQLAKLRGAGKVIATASTEEKRSSAVQLGADAAVDYTKAGWEKEVLSLTDGKGVDVALEMAGGDIFAETLRCLAAFGRLVVYGAASGNAATFNPIQLMRKNQSVVGFFLPQMMKRPAQYQQSLKELLEYTDRGELETIIGGIYPLSEAPMVHELMQSRKTHGKLVLVP